VQEKLRTSFKYSAIQVPKNTGVLNITKVSYELCLIPPKKDFKIKKLKFWSKVSL